MPSRSKGSSGGGHRDRLRSAARRAFGWTTFRDGQLEGMEQILDGRDVLAVLASGYGKSALYQVPALLLDGPTLVISPLIALQRDQVAGIDASPDAPEAVAVNSAERDSDVEESWDTVSRDAAEYLFLAPEQLANEQVLDRLAGLDVSLVAVDEAHCVSAWGHDFRPDYLRIGGALDRIGHPTVVALTATASPPVREEIVDRLGLRDPYVLVRGFDRPEIHLQVDRYVDEDSRRRDVVDRVAELETPGLLYVATRKDTTRYAEALAERGLRTGAYHAGLKTAERRRVHEQFGAGNLDLVVATSAFGMGIDKPDVRFVAHAAAPGSLDSYYQEVGRAGRDGDPALALLFYRSEDFGLARFFTGNGADPDTLRTVFAHVRDSSAPVRITALRHELGLPARRVTAAVNLLEGTAALRSTRRGLRARDVPVDRAVDEAVDAAEARQRMERSRIEMMRQYAEATRCRRQLLLSYFGEQLDRPCGNCDVCAETGGRDDRESGAPADTPYPVGTAVRHRSWGPGTVMEAEPDRITVLFDREGYRTLALQVVQDEELLARE